MEYTIKDLSRLINKSEQSIYKLIKKKAEFASIVEANSREEGANHTKLYSQPCLDWLIKHYKIELVDDGVGIGDTENAKDKTPNTTSPTIESLSSKVEKLRKRVKRLKAENERLIEENDRLLTLLEKEQETRQGLLVSLVAEKKEKHLLLEDPEKKKHWWSRKK